jgi:hypothetical protein
MGLKSIEKAYHAYSRKDTILHIKNTDHLLKLSLDFGEKLLSLQTTFNLEVTSQLAFSRHKNKQVIL